MAIHGGLCVFFYFTTHIDDFKLEASEIVKDGTTVYICYNNILLHNNTVVSSYSYTGVFRNMYIYLHYLLLSLLQVPILGT